METLIHLIYIGRKLNQNKKIDYRFCYKDKHESTISFNRQVAKGACVGSVISCNEHEDNSTFSGFALSGIVDQKEQGLLRVKAQVYEQEIIKYQQATKMQADPMGNIANQIAFYIKDLGAAKRAVFWDLLREKTFDEIKSYKKK